MRATEAFFDKNWGIRNAGLMAFSVLTKKLFGTCSTQDAEINKRGKNIVDFVIEYPLLGDFFYTKLEYAYSTKQTDKVFPIFLLLSKLYYSSEMEVEKFDIPQISQILDTLKKMCVLIEKFMCSPNIHVRQISGQARASFIKENTYFREITHLLAGMPSHKHDLNKIHGELNMIIYMLNKLPLLKEVEIENKEAQAQEMLNMLHHFIKEIQLTGFVGQQAIIVADICLAFPSETLKDIYNYLLSIVEKMVDPLVKKQAGIFILSKYAY